ncbi:MAG: DUF4386 domain-containing protein [Candidatus Hermodarchaeota archaeon]
MNPIDEKNTWRKSLGKNTDRFLGAVFLLQAITALSAGMIRDSVFGTGDIVDSLINISNNVWLVQIGMAVEFITAIGIVILGSLMYLILKGQDARLALIAMGLYFVEVAALIISQIAISALIGISLDSVTAGHPAYLQSLGTVFLGIQGFAFSYVLMLFFSLGASIFYYLFYRSGYLPNWLILFGMIAAVGSFVSVLIALFGVMDLEVFMVVIMLNLPFELTNGLWLLIKGFRGD